VDLDPFVFKPNSPEKKVPGSGSNSEESSNSEDSPSYSESRIESAKMRRL
jgi:hypothetical protein